MQPAHHSYGRFGIPDNVMDYYIQKTLKVCVTSESVVCIMHKYRKEEKALVLTVHEATPTDQGCREKTSLKVCVKVKV